jgi:hypothetical protein
MKRIVGFMLILGLIAGSLAAPAMAKKKKPRKPAAVQVDQKFFLRRDDCGGDADNPHLSVVDAPDAGNGCGNYAYGAPNEVIGNVDVPFAEVFPTTDGVPFVLDGSKEIKGSLTYDGLHGKAENPVALGAGVHHIDIVLTGTVGGTSTEVGTASGEFTATPGTDQYTVDFSIKPESSLDKASFSSLELSLTVRGPGTMASFLEMDDPASFITVPVWGTATK